MGIFDGLMGNASEVTIENVEKEYSKILSSSERVEKAYRLIRDMFIFTNKRLIMVDKQGVTGKKTEYHSIPYRAITHFSIETSGHFDLDAELKIWISGTQMPIQKQFNKSLDIYELQSVLAEYALR
ncbi:PH domain-containing protein [Clostridium sp. MSJ-11]|uniref:PH domain-containing protein n=1 Tax=Clostridium mobile TaxID=2841512 RepID=A0ABS6EHT7_9CLOT|nr:PH domain-containing protein [Clostridium mobile]MBU5484030.1 PH domain-containing protein [Clostridium mobile]